MTSSRRARRFYSQEDLPAESEIFSLSPEESRHLKTVLRLKAGDLCRVADRGGREAECVVEGIRSDGCVQLMLKSFVESRRKNSLSLRVYQAIPKGVKFDFLVQKAQEIGVSELVPLMSERTLVRIDEKKESPKWARWNKIAAEAAKQSGCRERLEIFSPVTFSQALAEIKESSAPLAVFHPGEESVGFRDWLEDLEQNWQGPHGTKLVLFIGPEGGFSRREIELLKKQASDMKRAFYLVSLGDSILKADTAFIAVTSALRLYFVQELD